MNKDMWNEICFILTKSVPNNSSEQLFESKVIQAFEKLGWSHFKNEISVREKIQIGSSGRISPDLIIRSEEKNLIVVEVKRPSENLSNPSYQNQLASYMRMLRLNFGILIGNEIKIFVDGSLIDSNKPELLETIEFTDNNQKGVNFISLFKKDTFSVCKIESYIKTKVERLKEDYTIKYLKKEIRNSEYNKHLKEKLKEKLLNEYDISIVDEVMSDVEVDITNTEKKSFQNTSLALQPKTVIGSYKMTDNELELIKIHKKVPIWFKKPYQKNSQILIKFLKLKERKNVVTFFELENSCKNITNFRSSYQAMKAISDRNNAKVFEETGHIVKLWNPAKDFIENEYKKYIDDK